MMTGMQPNISRPVNLTRRDALRLGAAVAGFGLAGCGTNLGLARDASRRVVDAGASTELLTAAFAFEGS